MATGGSGSITEGGAERALEGESGTEKTVEDFSKAFEGLEDLSKRLKMTEEQWKKIQEQGADAVQETLKALEKQLEAMGILGKEAKQKLAELTTEAINGNKEAQKTLANLEKGMVAIASAKKKAVEAIDSMNNYLGVSLDTIFNLIKAVDEVPKAFSSSTGIAANLAEEMTDVVAATGRANVTLQEAGQGFQTLASSFSAFHQSNSALNTQLVENMALMSKLGVSMESTAGSADFLNRSLGMTEQAAMNLTREIATSGEGMGVTASKMISDFQSVSGRFAIYGDRIGQVFKGLAAQAKATGIEISALIGLADKFDTFDSAADSAGKLNAVLGTQLSTVDMLNMDHEERLDMLRNQIQTTIGDFNTLDKFTQQYIADTLGMDVGSAGRFINMSAAEVEQYKLQKEEAKKTQEELNKVTEKFVPIMQQLQMQFQQMIIENKDLMTGIIESVQAFSKFIIENKGMIKALMVFGIAVKATVAVLGTLKLLSDVALGMQALAKANLIAEVSFKGLNASMGVFALVMTAASYFFMSGMIAEGLYTMAVGVGVLTYAFFGLNASLGVVGLLFGALYFIFGQKINPLFIQAFAFMAVGVLALAVAFAVLNYSGGALVAGALALMFASVALLVYSLKEFLATLAGLEEVLPKLAAPLMQLGIALSAIGMMFVNPLVAIGMAVFVASLVAVASAVYMMGVGVDKMVSGLSKVKGVVAGLEGALKDSFIAITATPQATSAIMANGAALGGINAGNITVDVNIPKIKSPEVNVKVFLDGSELRSIIKDVISGAG